MADSIEIYFNFINKQLYFIKAKLSEYFKDICEKFAKNNDLYIHNIFFIYKRKRININSSLTVRDQFKLYQMNKNELEHFKIKIKVCVDTGFFVKFVYKERDIFIKFKRCDTKEKIFLKFSEKVQKNINDLTFLENGWEKYENNGQKYRRVIVYDNDADLNDEILDKEITKNFTEEIEHEEEPEDDDEDEDVKKDK